MKLVQIGALDAPICTRRQRVGDPHLWVAEAARVLKPDGWLVFMVNSVLSTLCVPTTGPASACLQRPYRALGRMEFDGVEYHPTHAEWIKILRAHGFSVEALHELTAAAGVDDPAFYEIVDAHWARQWPAEDLWVARRTT